MALTEPIIPEWTTGDRMAKAREIAGLNQQQMAERMGVKRTTLSAWERGENQPRNYLSIIDQWGDITGVDPAWILGFRNRWSLLREVQIPSGQMELALDTDVHTGDLVMAS